MILLPFLPSDLLAPLESWFSRRLVKKNQIQNPKQGHVKFQEGRSVIMCQDEGPKRVSVSSDADESSVVSVGRSRKRSSGRNAGKGHQRRHQEWLDRFGKVQLRPRSPTGLYNKAVYKRPSEGVAMLP